MNNVYLQCALAKVTWQTSGVWLQIMEGVTAVKFGVCFPAHVRRYALGVESISKPLNVRYICTAVNAHSGQVSAGVTMMLSYEGFAFI